MIEERLDAKTKEAWEMHRDIAALPRLEEMTEFLERRVKIEANATSQEPEARRSRADVATPRSAPYPSSPGPSRRAPLPCRICRGDHPLFKCSKFLTLTVNERKERIKQLNLCMNCLRADHPADKCHFGPCWRCPGRQFHNSTLCQSLGQAQRVNQVQLREEQEMDHQPSAEQPRDWNDE